jgi:hypothetical protein
MISTTSILEIIFPVSYLKKREDRNMPDDSGGKGKEGTGIPV